MAERNRFSRLTEKWAADQAKLKEDHQRDPEGSRRRWHAQVDDNKRREQEIREKYGRRR